MSVAVAPVSSVTPVAVGPRPGGARPRSRAGAVAPVVLALRRFPNPRLTGIGAGLFAALAMFLLACLDWLLLDGSAVAYGLLFLPVSALTALWVRPADLVTAPISVPIAFAVGVIPIAGGRAASAVRRWRSSPRSPSMPAGSTAAPWSPG